MWQNKNLSISRFQNEWHRGSHGHNPLQPISKKTEWRALKFLKWIHPMWTNLQLQNWLANMCTDYHSQWKVKIWRHLQLLSFKKPVVKWHLNTNNQLSSSFRQKYNLLGFLYITNIFVTINLDKHYHLQTNLLSLFRTLIDWGMQNT
jgi:hypothetical protein